MPNWVYSKLSVSGDAADVQRLKAQVGAPYTQTVPDWSDRTKMTTVENTDDFSFWNIVRPPEEKLDLYHGIHDGTEDKEWGWYNWNCEHWGTKWDAGDTSLNEYSEDNISYDFSTAWSPPVAAIATLSTQYPTLNITMDWEEEQGYGGTLDFTNGTVTVLDEYDIPATHEEMIFRKGYCWCDDSDPEDMPFTDCPGAIPAPSPEMLIPYNELDVEALS